MNLLYILSSITTSFAFQNFVLLQEIFTPDTIDGLVVIIFSTIAAIFSVVLDRRKKRNNSFNPDHESQILEKVFDELQKTIEMLRQENHDLMSHNTNLNSTLEEYRDRYHEQLKESSDLIWDISYHREVIDELNEKIDNLVEELKTTTCDISGSSSLD